MTANQVEWGDPSQWTFPVADLGMGGAVYRAKITDRWGSPRPNGKFHRGVDIMFERRSRSDRPEYAPPVDGSPMFFAPPGTEVLAARDGSVWMSGDTERGRSVILDHGKPWATYYTHMERLALPLVNRGKTAAGDVYRVKAGDVIGYMGGDPMTAPHLRHLHFAAWYKGPERCAVDPERAMVSWRRPILFTR